MSTPIVTPTGPFTDEDRLRSLVGYAVLAPSDRNTQPWRFTVADGALELWADRERALPVGDPTGRSLTVSCGAALFHVRLALRHYGYAGAVTRLPDADRPDLLACVRLGAYHPVTPAEEQLFDAIPRRNTNRRAFTDRFVPPYLLEALQEAADAEGARLTVVTTETDKGAVAGIVASADHAQMADDALRDERASWLHPAHDPRHDGLGGYALGLPALLDGATPLLAASLRHDADGLKQAARDAEAAEGPGVIAILSTDADTPRAWLRAGEALAHVLLRAAAAGVSASFLNAAVEVPAHREELARTMGVPGHPLLVFRLGFGPKLAYATPRRPVRDVLEG